MDKGQIRDSKIKPRLERKKIKRLSLKHTHGKHAHHGDDYKSSP